MVRMERRSSGGVGGRMTKLKYSDLNIHTGFEKFISDGLVIYKLYLYTEYNHLYCADIVGEFSLGEAVEGNITGLIDHIRFHKSAIENALND